MINILVNSYFIVLYQISEESLYLWILSVMILKPLGATL